MQPTTRWTARFLAILLALALLPATHATSAAGPSVFINEIHYDNGGTDSGEAIEVAGPAGTDLTGWSIVLYNGANGADYDTIALSGVIPNQQGGYGTLAFLRAGIQNGGPDGMALVDAGNTVIQFLSYEGTFVAVGGPANGLTSTDIGVSESGSGPVNESLQLTGSGTGYDDFSWAASQPNTFGMTNTDQTFGSGPVAPVVVISEIRIDQPGTDDDEYFELSGAPAIALDGLTYLVIGDGTGGSGVIEAVIDLAGQSLDSNGFFVAAESTFSLGSANLTTNLNFENDDNFTHLLVWQFTGSNGDDLDTNDDGTLDVAPWTSVVDTIALVKEPNPPTSTEYYYGSTSIGPDGSFVPSHVLLCNDGWRIGGFDPTLGDDTPGAANLCTSPAAPTLVINEVDYDQPDTDTAEFVELKNVGASDVNLNGVSLELINGNGGAAYDTIVLPAVTLAVGDYFVICANAANTANCDLDDGPDTNFIQNGAPDAVALRFAGQIIDAVSYEGDIAGYTEGSGSGLEDTGEGSIGRCDDGEDTGQNNVDFLLGAITPGATNTCPPPVPAFGVCSDPATAIHFVQGSGPASLEVGNYHTLEGIVVGDFQNTSTQLSGFFLQEEDGDWDTDATTSEGIFVYDPALSLDVNAGDLVRVQGIVTEFNGLTELTNITNLALCASGQTATVTPVSLPVSSLETWERLEGMAISIAQPLYVTGNFTQGRYGEVDLSVSERLFNPTNVVAPGAAANALQELNDRSRIQLDDGSNVQNPTPLPPYLGGDGTLRAGDSVSGLTGVLGYAFGTYEIQPTGPVTVNRLNQRTATPDPVGGTVRVASMNVLNYFNGDGVGGGFPTPRGATTLDEFNRQRDKIVSAIVAMDADVVGLMELENDGSGADSAIQDLVNGLNAATAPGTYDHIVTGVFGTDEIRVGLLFQPGRVTPVGSHAILDSSVDPRFVDTKNRPALAQTFDANGERFTVAVNHLKSKGSDCDSLGDPDTGDGQGNCNGTRTLAAQALVDWLATDPTGSGDPDILIIGDLNAYAMEDPVTAIQAGPDDVLGSSDDYTNLIQSFVGADAYSYIFQGQTGYLDHALASPSLTSQVTGVTEWHINADEPVALDYNDYNQPLLYASDAYRASDHDPVLVGLALDSVTTITIVKDAQPNTARNFAFSGDLGSFALDDPSHDDGDAVGSSQTFTVAPGSYTVQEQASAQWPLGEIVCDPETNATVNLAAGSVTISVALGDDATCTFVNQYPSYVLAFKYFDRNANGRWNWEPGLRNWEIQLYDAQDALVASQTTNFFGKALFTRVMPGDYRICEVQKSGWSNSQPGVNDPSIGQPCYSVTIAAAQLWLVPFGNHRSAHVAASGVAQVEGLTVEPLAGPDTVEGADAELAEQNQWLESPLGGQELFLPAVQR